MNLYWEETGIEGAKVITIENRGIKNEDSLTYDKKAFRKIGIIDDFKQDNSSSSLKGVIRGIGYQKKVQQSKLVRVSRGEIYDVLIDMRKNSVSYKKVFEIYLSQENQKLLYIPKGVAHGFQALSEVAIVDFKVSDYFVQGDEVGVRWDDPAFMINWPIKDENKVIVGDRDQSWEWFKEK